MAESAPQVGGTYLGPQNHGAARELGLFAGRQKAGSDAAHAEILLVALEALPNTRDRVEGFLAGFAEAFPGTLTAHRVDGRGSFREAIRQTTDSLSTHPGIDVVFGVNDHTILGALEVAKTLGHDGIDAYSVGGEGGSLFEELSRHGRLRATLALFPEVVGRLGVDAVCRRLSGERLGDAVVTPAEVLTPATLGDFYRREDDGWRLHPEKLERMCAGRSYFGASLAGKSIGFMLHYPSHEWYRNLAAAMRQRCAVFGIDLVLRNAEDEVAEQIRFIRRSIGRTAAEQIGPRQTVLIDGGEASLYLAEALHENPMPLTVVTNSLDVLDRLAGLPDIKVLLTGGEFQATSRILVGPSVGALLATMRADKAFVSPNGMSASFGLSFEDERTALVCRRFADVAREVVVLADHSVIALESNVQAVRPADVHAVITDAGTLSSHRLELSAAGLRVTLADEEDRAVSAALKAG